MTPWKNQKKSRRAKTTEEERASSSVDSRLKISGMTKREASLLSPRGERSPIKSFFSQSHSPYSSRKRWEENHQRILCFLSLQNLQAKRLPLQGELFIGEYFKGWLDSTKTPLVAFIED
ncbi:MAG TPA: hypothetical protein PKU87_06235 [Candidatus Atribacteria bacterium]|nr:hypothetical protein [Candidatus Atribacteria bacterium]